MSGTPQGSYFGALLYITYINDIIKVIENSKILLYIDDLKIYKKIDNPNDLNLLNKDLCNINEWNNKNGLEFNEFKCKVMIFGKKLDNNETIFKINNQELQIVNSFKDLGIIFDNKLTFRDHVFHMISKAKKSLWLLKYHSKKFKNVDAIILLYNSLVKSKLMFGSIIWNTYNEGLIYEIEKVQNDFLRYIAFKLHIQYDHFDHNYSEIQNILGIFSLCTSRNLHDLIFVLSCLIIRLIY